MHGTWCTRYPTTAKKVSGCDKWPPVVTSRSLPPAAVSYRGLTFSLDGNFLYYVVTENGLIGSLFEMPLLGGTAKKLAYDVDSPATLSPAGKQLAFLRGNPRASEVILSITGTDGKGERQLAAYKVPSFAWSLVAAWSPDGKTIVHTINRTDDTGSYVTLIATPAQTEAKEVFTASRWQYVTGAAWTVDGQGLVLNAADRTSSGQLWYLPFPVGEPRQITNDLSQYFGVSLNADSSALVSLQRERLSTIWVAPNGTAAAAKQVTHAVSRDLVKSGVAWTPDGEIIYAHRAGSNYDLWITPVDGREPKQLTANAGNNLLPRVSPDGRQIVFSSDRTGTSHVWKMGIDGSDATQLTNGDGEGFPDWSRDGRWVVYGSTRMTLWKVSADGGNPVQLMHEHAMLPSISPDGRWLCFEYVDGSGTAIMPFDGGPAGRLFKVSLPAESDQVRWSPDSTALVYIKTKDGVSNIWSQPIDGGPPRQVSDFQSDQIFAFDWSRDGKLACARGVLNGDVVLIRDLK